MRSSARAISLFTMSSAEAGEALDASPSVLAYLLEQGLLRAFVRGLSPQWSGVWFDPVAVAMLAHGAPRELAAARLAAPCYRTLEMARACALGVALRISRH